MSTLTAADWKKRAEHWTERAESFANRAEHWTERAEGYTRWAEMSRDIAAFCEQQATELEGAGK
ncbi:hypothetical protein ACUIAJ_03995 [Dermabacteraceae bacterium CCM 9519]